MAIVLNTKTYNFRGFQAPNSISNFLETSAGVPAGFSNLTCKIEDGGSKSATKVRWKLKVPTVATEASTCVCPGTVINDDFVDLVLTFSAGTPLAKRTDVLTRLQQLVLKAEFIASVNDLVQPSA